MCSLRQDNSIIESVKTLLVKSLPVMTNDSQRLSLSIYQLLGKGLAVSIAQLSTHSGLSCDYITRELRRIANTDSCENKQDNNKKHDNQTNSLVSFLGLTLNKTDHLFTVNNNDLYTWCAWDGLFITQLLESRVRLTSQCPVSNEIVVITVSKSGVDDTDMQDVCMSMLMPTDAAMQKNLRGHFCEYVKFFRSVKAGQQWCDANEGTFLLSIEQAWQLALQVNQARYSGKC